MYYLWLRATDVYRNRLFFITCMETIVFADPVQGEQPVKRRLRGSQQLRSAAADGTRPGGAAPIRRARAATGRVLAATAATADFAALARQTRRRRQADRRRPSTRQREPAQQQRQRFQQRSAAGARSRLLGRRERQVSPNRTAI